ncbi:MAG: D-alanyl-D-alanine carboxypeptidase [Actinomycetota bacterium]|nr:D-alanyl-D-alanine carboxypeptidase [Actinomycetota bacterium]
MPRRARRPLLMLGVLAFVPAVALGSLAFVANGRAAGPIVPVTTSTAPPVLPAVLPTPLLSVRRAPAVLAGDRRADVLAAAVVPVVEAVDGSSCVAVGLDDTLVATRNTELAVVPASNLKVVTAAVALEVLGPGATFTTSLTGPAAVDGVVQGDVHLVGGGDPLLSEAWYTQPSATRKRPPLHTTSAEALADQLVAAGVTRITGKVLGDGSRYDDERYPPGWSADIRASTDGVAVGALVINDSVSTSGALGTDPAASAAATFRALLAQRGITVAGGSGTGVAPAGQPVLAAIQSAPLTEVLQEMLTTSDNLTAEMLVKEIGLASGGPGRGTRNDGLQAIVTTIAGWGVPTAGIALTDGSGLSYDNQFTCGALVAVLQHGSAVDAVGAGLARGGQDGSTLVDAFEQPGLVGVLQGKTGSLNNPVKVKALCGYFMAGAAEVEFVLILNGASAAEYQAAWDRLATALVALTAAPAGEAMAPKPAVG